MMTNSQRLSEALTERFGLPVSATDRMTTEGQTIVIQPSEIPFTISFQVHVLLGWRTVTATFAPGNYASELMKAMSSATADQKAAFKVFANSLNSKGASVALKFDSSAYEPSAPEKWPDDWRSISLSMRKTGLVIENDSRYNIEEAFRWATGFFGMSLSLLPLETVEENPFSDVKEPMIGYEEGKAIMLTVKRYERSKINRAACIEIHGTNCAVCGLDLGEKYGRIGEGFIHIHHIVPVSQLGEGYVINPATDLVPLCPNCHAMSHRKNPPFTVKELKVLLDRDNNGY